jgi:ketosteroid isomerase-like protein
MHANEKLLRTVLDAIAAGDGATVAELMADDLVVHVPGGSRIAGDHHGRGVFRARVQELTGAALRIEPRDVLGSDDHAVGVYTMHLDLPDGTVSWQHVNVYRIRNGKIVEVWENPFEQDVFDGLFG